MKFTLAADTKSGVTATERLLAAAYELELLGLSVWSLADLTVRAWQADKKVFGLTGYEKDYPDHNRVKVAVYHKRLGFARHVEQVGPNRYCLSVDGYAYAQRVKAAIDSLNRATASEPHGAA